MGDSLEALALGNRFAARGDFLQAVDCFESALASDPDRPELLCNLGNALREMGRLDEAVSWLRRAVDRSPLFPEASVNLAAALEGKGEFQEAECALRAALRSNPELACAWSTLGSVLQKQGRSQEALLHVREALRIEPQFPFRVGVAWAGSPHNTNDSVRSLPLSKLTGLGAVPGVSFYSLQKGEAAKESVTAGLPFSASPARTADLADTAALISQFDLVISVDTMVAHLAGALGKPVWTLLSFASDWRWLRDRNDSPWHPTIRLFRPTSPGNSGPVLDQLAALLRKNSQNAKLQ
jgi:tetratricopeptide (TPR) repeat protein